MQKEVLMMRYRKEITLLILQLLVLYIPLLLSEPDETIGMVLWMLILTGVLSCLQGFFAKGAVKYLHPFATSLLFIPSVYIYYNESALIHALWYVCISMIGILLGTSLRRLIGWSNDRKQD